MGGFWVPLLLQLPLPELVTVPQVNGPEPTSVWLAIGSYVAVVFAGSMVIIAADGLGLPQLAGR